MPDSLTAGDAALRPIRLQAHIASGTLAIEVVGYSERPFSGALSVEVAANGNRSVHRCSVALAPRERAVFTRVSIGAQGPWSARLVVEGADGTSYEETRSS